jgi:hypothetical protein
MHCYRCAGIQVPRPGVRHHLWGPSEAAPPHRNYSPSFHSFKFTTIEISVVDLNIFLLDPDPQIRNPKFRIRIQQAN